MHVGNMAEYYFSIDENELHMKFVIDKDELFNFKFDKGCDLHKMTAFCAGNYILSNIFVKINGDTIKMEQGDSSIKDGHLILYFSAPLKNVKIQHLAIENKCFYAFDPSFQNRVILSIDKFQGSYLFNANKHAISLK